MDEAHICVAHETLISAVKGHGRSKSFRQACFSSIGPYVETMNTFRIR